MTTRDGFYFENGPAILQRGLKCSGSIQPLQKIDTEGPTYDAIVIGAGFAGLTACRDLCVAGLKVLLLEARDRIGGRTYTAEVDGHLYEMGGTWVHWTQPHVYREMSRYGLTNLVHSHGEAVGFNYLTTSLNGERSNMDPKKARSMLGKAFTLLCNVDGRLGREIIPFPHNPHHNCDAEKWEKMSVLQRLDEVKTDLSTQETSLLQSFLSSICGSEMKDVGFFDVLRWWALGGYSVDGLYETGDDYKILEGQSRFAQYFFDEALQTRNLSYSFDTRVTSIVDQGSLVTVNENWHAKRLICTVPLNVLHGIRFSPPLSQSKIAALSPGNINKGSKFHLEVSGSQLRPWAGAYWPVERLFHASGDSRTPDRNTHIVCFGTTGPFPTPEEDARTFVADCERLHSMTVKKTVWHDWCTDPFSLGSWCMFPPDYSFRNLEALQEQAGNIQFANSDWASGWRGFIDGAIEQGGIVARRVSLGLHSLKEIEAYRSLSP